MSVSRSLNFAQTEQKELFPSQQATQEQGQDGGMYVGWSKLLANWNTTEAKAFREKAVSIVAHILF